MVAGLVRSMAAAAILAAAVGISACCNDGSKEPPCGSEKASAEKGKAPAKPTGEKPGASKPAADAPAAGAAPAAAAAKPAGKHGDGHGEAPLHNYKRLSEHVISGASPETKEDIAYLASQGVKTIITVDGAVPMVDEATRHGIRYVHVPIGYDGIPRDQQVLLAKAFTTLDGPFYVHCHHGKHRGPAACMIGRILLDGIDPTQATAEMKDRGTDPKYKGLYAVPEKFAKPTAEELAAAPATFPSTVRPQGLTGAMVVIDEGWERMKQVKTAKWAAPQDHPDVDPPHEAAMLVQYFREAARGADATAHGEAFLAMMKVSEDAAVELEAALREQPVDADRAARAFDAGASSCAKCHTKYRDNQ